MKGIILPIIKDDSNWGGITLFPFILTKKKHMNNEPLLNHERIHLSQQLETLIIPFYLLYILMWVVNVFRYGTGPLVAYRNIAFEKEAHTNGSNLDYLKSRKAYAWFKYL